MDVFLWARYPCRVIRNAGRDEADDRNRASTFATVNMTEQVTTSSAQHLMPHLSHTKCFQSREAEVNSPTNLSTYSLPLIMKKIR